jgi:hypothetical protein
MIRNFWDVKRSREVHLHVEEEFDGVLVGILCHEDTDKSYQAVLVEVAPGIWERRS